MWTESDRLLAQMTVRRLLQIIIINGVTENRCSMMSIEDKPRIKYLVDF